MAESKSFSDASHALNELSHALAMLEAENNNLRNLVTDMYRDIGAAYVEGRPLAPYAYDDRMRELGIEVDG